MYKIIFRGLANRQVQKLPPNYFRLVQQHINNLVNNPRPPDSEKLTGEEGYALRVGVYRVLYEIDDPARTITIYRVKHRREVYRKS